MLDALSTYGRFHSHEGIQNGGFLMEDPIKMDDLSVPLFQETPIRQLHWDHLEHVSLS